MLKETPKPNKSRETESGKFEPLKISASTGHNNMPCIELVNASDKTRDIIRNVMTSNWIKDPAYILRTSAGAFLQGDQEGWILVEFWNEDKAAQQAFVDHLNKLLSAN